VYAEAMLKKYIMKPKYAQTEAFVLLAFFCFICFYWATKLIFQLLKFSC
jgi:hypothetical protein